MSHTSELDILDNLQNTEQTQQNIKSNHLIENHNFEKLLAIQEEIYQATKVKPSLYKLINLIIKQSELNAIRDQLIKQYQD